MATTGCIQPIQRSLRDAELAKTSVLPRAVRVASIEVTDDRPAEERQPLSPDVRYVVPLLIWNQWATEGHLRPDATLYSLDVNGELREVMQDAFKRSGILGGDEGVAVKLKVKLLHLYGITHASDSAMVTLGGGGAQQRTFAPYGYASATVQLLEGDRVLATRNVVGFFDPNLMDLVGKQAARSMTDKLTLAAVQAAGNLASNTVRALEPVLGKFPQAKPLDVDKISTFFIVRAVEEGPFLEMAGVKIDTGEVISDVVVPRWMEPYSAINEWVVDPYHGGQARLSPEEYDRLVKRVQERFDARYVTDVRTAHFFGGKAAPPSAPPAQPKSKKSK